jgi:endoglucanase
MMPSSQRLKRRLSNDLSRLRLNDLNRDHLARGLSWDGGGLFGVAVALIALLCLSSFASAQANFDWSNKRGQTDLINAEPLFEGRRGVGVVRTFLFPTTDPKNPKEYQAEPYVPNWATTMPPERMRELVQVGFDFLRVAVDPGPLLEADAATLNFRIQEITHAVEQSLAVGMKILVDIHPSETHPLWNHMRLTAGRDDPAFHRLIEIERALAQALAKYDPRAVALEVFNEPPPPCVWQDRPEWPTQLKTIYDEVRSVAPHLTLVVAGACWASIEGLVLLDPSQFDKNTIFAFHYYEPPVFTLQGEPWGQSYLRYVPRLKFPPDYPDRDTIIKAVQQRIRAATDLEEEKKEAVIADAGTYLGKYFSERDWPQHIANQIDSVANWANENGIGRNRIILSEFGTLGDVWNLTAAAPEDRMRWTESVRKVAETNGYRWAIWCLTNSGGIIKGDEEGPLDPLIVKALGFNVQ